jgi:hypothetical protein
MPIVKNTATGNNYLEKINTDGDICSTTAIRSYEKQLGSQGSSGRTRFTLPFTYDPGSHTLWVFLDGEKVVPELTPVDNTQYKEYSNRIVQFPIPVNPDSVLEFIVAGSYIDDGSGTGTGGGGGGTGTIDPILIVGPGIFTISNLDTAIMVDTTGGNTTITVPLASTMDHLLRVVKISPDANVVYVVPTVGDTIENTAQIVLTNRYDAVSLLPFALQSVWVEV